MVNLEEKYKVKLNERPKEQNDQDEVILFFSYDVVNSSAYKSINYYGWAQTLLDLFKKLCQRVKDNIYESELWRVLGDEAIFIVRIKSKEDVDQYTKKVYKILVDTIKDLKNGTFFDDIKDFSSKEISLMKLQNILSLKAAAWIAMVSKIGSDHNYTENIFEIYDIEPKNRFYEFLGNDIDAGFRIKEHTNDGRLVLSYELAVLLSQFTDNLRKLNIITYKRLKGVWGNKYYPVIWYDEHENFEQSFEFDAKENEPIIREYFENRNKSQSNIIREEKMFSNTDFALTKIKTDRNLEQKIKRMEEVINNTAPKKKDYLKAPMLELHFVAICYSQAKKKVLIAKRTPEREIEAGKWEFGCAKANRESSISESIKIEYKEDFGIDIKLVLDESRELTEPVPIALYEIEKVDGIHKGIIVLAEIVGEFEIESFKKTAKHQEVRWIKEEEIDNFNELCVTDFKSTLKKVFQEMKRKENHG